MNALGACISPRDLPCFRKQQRFHPLLYEDNLHLDPRDLLYGDNLHVDARDLLDEDNLHLDARDLLNGDNLHLDARDLLNGDNLHLDARDLLDGDNLHLDARDLLYEGGGQGGSLITIHKEKKHLFTFHVENKLNSHFTWN